MYSLYPRKQHYQARWDLRGEEREGQGRKEKVRGGGRRSGEEGEGRSGRRNEVMSYAHGTHALLCTWYTCPPMHMVHMPSYAHGTHALLCTWYTCPPMYMVHMPSYAHGTHALLCTGLAHQFPAQSRQTIGRRERSHSQAACTPHGQP